MQAERDLLHQSVFPEIRRKLKKYNEDIQELDLRWGVDTSLMTEEESGKHVIESCIDSIDRCRPYMIVLIGERYGWIPENTLVEDTHDDRIRNCYKEPISITQMEILYGALEQESVERCIFCFRDEHFSEQIPENERSIYAAESKMHAEKLAALKKKIRETKGAKIIEYNPKWDDGTKQVTELQAFETQILNGLWNMMESEVEGRVNICPEEQIIEQAKMTAKRYADSYIERKNMNEASVLNGRGAVWYYGTGGCGKSAFLSHIYTGAIAIKNHAFIYYCGNENCGNVDTFLNTLLYWLRSEHEQKFTEDDRNCYRSQKLHRITELLKRRRTCDRMIFIDAVDQMEEDMLDILTHIANTIIREKVGLCTFGMVVTSLDDYMTANVKRIQMGDFSYWKIGEMDGTEIIAIAQLHSKLRGKHLDSRAQTAIREKKSSGNPYYLSLLLQQLFMMDGTDFRKAEQLAPGMEGLSLYMTQMIQSLPESLNEMTVYTLQHAVNKLNQKVQMIKGNWNRIDPMDVFALIAVSKNGLTLGELEDMTDMEQQLLLPMEMQKLLCLLYDAFRESYSGKWDFSHRIMRENVLEHLPEKKYKEIANLLSEYYRKNHNDADAFYYALRAEDTQKIGETIHKIMNFEGLKQKAFLGIYRSYLIKTQKCFELDDEYGWFISKMILNDPDQSLQEEVFWKKLLEDANAKNDNKKIRFYLQIAELVFEKYGENGNIYIAEFDKLENLFEGLKQLEKEDVTAYIDTMLQAVTQYRCRWHFTKIGQKIHSVLKKTEVNDSRVRMISELLMLWDLAFTQDKKKKEEALEAISEKITFMLSLFDKNAWEEYSEFEKTLYRALASQALVLASIYTGLGQYGKAFNTGKSVEEWIHSRAGNNPTIAERLLYSRHLCNLMGYMKADYVYKHVVKKNISQCELLAEMIPNFFFQYQKALSYYMESYVLDKAKQMGYEEPRYEDEYRIAYREAIKCYDGLLTGKKDEEKNLGILEDVLYLRYRRVKLRLEDDIWTWNADHSVNIGKKSSWFEAMMEDDLKHLAEDGYFLYCQDKNKDNMYSLGWSLLYGVQYYDKHQEADKLVKWCGGLLNVMKEINTLDPDGGRLNKIAFYLEMAEALERHNRSEDFYEIMEKARLLVSQLEVNTTKYADKIKRYKTRLCILQLKKRMFENVYEAKENFEFTKSFAEDFGKEEQHLMSDLKQSMAEVYYENGEMESAVQLLEEIQGLWPKVTSMWVPYDETKVQRQFRYLQGQRLLAQIQKNFVYMNQIIARYALIIRERTTDKDSARRPLLLEEAYRVKEIYQECFPNKPLSVDLQYILMLTEEVRKEEKRKELLKKEEILFSQLERLDGEDSELYLIKLNKVNDVQNEIWHDISKDSLEAKDLFKRKMNIAEKFISCRWERDEWSKALYWEEFFVSRFKYRKEWMEEFYPAEICWKYWENLIIKRAQIPYENRQVQLAWINIVEFGVAICERLWRETNDISWLFQAIEVYQAHKNYINQVKLRHLDDLEWNEEQIYGICTYEQKLYMKIWKSNLVNEEEWLPKFLQLIVDQLRMKLQAYPGRYQEILTRLYELQESALKNQMDIQKTIEMVTNVQAKGTDNFLFYLQKAARDLPGGTPTHVIMDYIEKLKEQE